MSAFIDFRTLPQQLPSLCIPRAFPNIDEKRIRRIFNDLGLGEIDRIDIVSKTTEKGEKFNRIFVHFSRWFANKDADTARERLLNGKDIKIVYDDPWFWKVSAYRPPAAAQPVRQQDARQRQRPHIEFDNEFQTQPRLAPRLDQTQPRIAQRPQDVRHYGPSNDLPKSNHTLLPPQLTIKKRNTNKKPAAAAKQTVEESKEDGEILETNV